MMPSKIRWRCMFEFTSNVRGQKLPGTASCEFCHDASPLFRFGRKVKRLHSFAVQKASVSSECQFGVSIKLLQSVLKRIGVSISRVMTQTCIC